MFEKIAMKKFGTLITTIATATLLTSCGGGSNTTTGSGGAPELSKQCTVSQIQPSVTSGTLSKNSDALSVNFNLNLAENLAIDIYSNIENSAADDWIEAPYYITTLAKGNHAITMNYDLNSPKKTAGDRYTKLNITVRLPENKACVANMPVNITLGK